MHVIHQQASHVRSEQQREGRKGLPVSTKDRGCARENYPSEEARLARKRVSQGHEVPFFPGVCHLFSNKPSNMFIRFTTAGGLMESNIKFLFRLD